MKKIIKNVSVMCALMTVMSKLAGETGFVYGNDMTEAQIRVAGKIS